MKPSFPEICYTAAIGITERMDACVHELSNGVHAGGAWSSQGAVHFGIVADDVTRIQVRDNHGELHDADMGRNSYWWDAQSADRSTWGVAVIATRDNGASAVIDLPDSAQTP